VKASKADMQWLNPALQLVKDTDPATYQRMQAEYWPVDVIDGPEDLEWIMDKAGFWEWAALMTEVPNAFGVTNTAKPGQEGNPLNHVTIINRPNIEYKARELGVPVAKLAADILVHEFAHRDKQADEPQAFKASTRFGRQLEHGDGPITKLSEETGEVAERGLYGLL
jgi:hypothetical protein